MTREQEEEDSAPLPPNYGLTLHTLVLAPRAAHRNYGAWMRDCLVKQGLEVGAAEALVQGIATKVNSSRAEVGLMRSYLAGLEARADPTLHSADLALLDCMMARIHISLDRVLSTGALPSPTSSPGRGDWEAGDTPELSLQAAHTLVPAVARLLTQLGTMARPGPTSSRPSPAHVTWRLTPPAAPRSSTPSLWRAPAAPPRPPWPCPSPPTSRPS